MAQRLQTGIVNGSASWCRRRAWDIPEDIWTEVTQETLFSLFKEALQNSIRTEA